MTDRTVHAITPNGERIVRLDRAGKWYVETGIVARRISIAEAVDLSTHRGSTVFLGRAGGKVFDSRVRKRILERTQ